MIELKQEFLNRSSARIFSLLPFEKTRADVARADDALHRWVEKPASTRLRRRFTTQATVTK